MTNGGHDYIWEKFYLAVLGLARSTDSLQSRLADAYLSHLMYAEHEGLPPELDGEYTKVLVALQKPVADPDGIGTVRVAAAQLSDAEARDLIELIVNLYTRHLRKKKGRR